MVVQLPIELVDSLTTFTLMNSGYTRSIEVGIIKYDHRHEGTIALRKLDNSSTEISFSSPNYPLLRDVLPSYVAIKMEAANKVSGIEYTEYAVQKLKEEFNRRLAAKQTRIDFLHSKFIEEEVRIRNLATKDSGKNGQDADESGKPEVAPSPEHQDQPTNKVAYDDLTYEEKLCLAWAYHDSITSENMDTFLSDIGHDGRTVGKNFISREQFKRMLRKAGIKGILVKQGRRWSPAPEYILIASKIRLY